jgi:hypothetical protein
MSQTQSRDYKVLTTIEGEEPRFRERFGKDCPEFRRRSSLRTDSWGSRKKSHHFSRSQPEHGAAKVD